MALGSRSSSFNYDVFLSFRGKDTRHGFTGHLYNALHSKGIHTFIVDEELQRGEQITPALTKAIQESRVAIAVLSQHYASSSFCLDELATILRCGQRKQLLVIPVFYKVDPSVVRHKKGSYGGGLAKLERRFKDDPEKLQKWKMALKQVADLSGYHFNDGDEYEYKFIEKIVEQVSRVINLCRPLHVADYPVGLKSRVSDVRKLLDAGSDDGVHMIGIHGMGGIGKSTLARAVYNELIIAEEFDGLCFLANVRENSNKHGLEHLQRVLLSEIIGEKNINLTSKPQGISIIQSRLTRRKVLLILDDVDTHEQLQAIAGRPDWFGSGSKIIITTRDKRLLSSYGVKRTYRVKGLNKNDALQLLSWKAFNTEKVDTSYVDILNRVVTYASGLPLALKAIGSILSGKSTKEWEFAINEFLVNSHPGLITATPFVRRHPLFLSYASGLPLVKKLNANDALQLPTWKAFKKEKADPTNVDVLHRAETYASDLPLASEVIGSKSFGKSIKERKFAINQYDSVGLESCSGAFSYDVFLSFIGSDTLHGFTGYLYKALHDSGIHTFIDEELQRGEEITPAIVKTIETSRIAIIVVSTNYASSSFFLDELVTILDCLKRKSLLVLPVFYNVDPSHWQPQKGSYGEALAKHEERFKHNMDKLEKLNMVLYQVATLSGFHIKHGTGYEYEFIGEIVEWVTNKINPAHYTVGLGSRVLEVKKLLDVGCHDGIHMLGIYGVGGVGKSTLAREVYNNLIAEHFDASCFIENVREKSEKHVQNILLSKILGEKDINLISMLEGISMVQSRLQPKKVLLILDDVDRHEQLKAVVGRPVWLGPGSIVIITAQDKQLLASLGVKKTYEVKELNKNDALQFLKWKAFKTQYFDPRYEEVLNRAVTYASGLPLALEIIGSNLFGKSVEEWESSIHQFEKSHDNPIQVILKASFDSLEEKERSVFLDVACCFKGYELAEVQDILHAHYGYCIKYYIDILVGKSLVKLSHGKKPCYDTVTLHDLIEGMGKEINRLESLTEPGERRRLRLPEDIREVLGYNKGTSKIEIICLDFPIFDEEAIVEWDGKAFQNMQNLKTLIIRNGNFSKGPEYLPNSLRVLEWWRYPSHCLPSDFHPKELSICKLPCSHISTIELTNLSRKCVNLRVLNFSSADV